MLKEGYIKAWRPIQMNEIYSDSISFHLWMHILFNANYEPKSWKGMQIQRGQLVTSIDSLVDELGGKPVTPKKIRGRLEGFKRANMVAIETTNKNTIITVLNYDKYQPLDNTKGKQNGEQEDNERANKGQQRKKDNNISTTTANMAAEFLPIDAAAIPVKVSPLCDPELAEVSRLYARSIGVIDEIIAGDIKDWMERVQKDAVEHAIKEAVRQNKKSASYINGIIKSMETAGVKDKASLDLYISQGKRTTPPGAMPPQPKGRYEI